MKSASSSDVASRKRSTWALLSASGSTCLIPNSPNGLQCSTLPFETLLTVLSSRRRFVRAGRRAKGCTSSQCQKNRKLTSKTQSGGIWDRCRTHTAGAAQVTRGGLTRLGVTQGFRASPCTVCHLYALAISVSSSSAIFRRCILKGVGHCRRRQCRTGNGSRAAGAVACCAEWKSSPPCEKVPAVKSCHHLSLHTVHTTSSSQSPRCPALLLRLPIVHQNYTTPDAPQGSACQGP